MYKKIIYIASIALASLAITSCSSDKAEDDPTFLPSADQEYGYSTPTYTMSYDYEWLEKGEPIRFNINKEFDLFTENSGLSQWAYIFDKLGRTCEVDFSEEFTQCRIVGGWVENKKNYLTRLIIPIESPATEVNVPGAGLCRLTEKGLSLEICGPGAFFPNCTRYSFALYIQGFKGNKEYRGELLINVGPKDNDNKKILIARYSLADNQEGWNMTDDVLYAPAKGGQASLNLNMRRSGLSIEINSESENLRQYLPIDDIITLHGTSAEYKLSAVTGRLNLDLKPNTTGKEIVTDVVVALEPTADDKGCVSGMALLKIVQSAD